MEVSRHEPMSRPRKKSHFKSSSCAKLLNLEKSYFSWQGRLYYLQCLPSANTSLTVVKGTWGTNNETPEKHQQSVCLLFFCDKLMKRRYNTPNCIGSGPFYFHFRIIFLQKSLSGLNTILAKHCQQIYLGCLCWKISNLLQKLGFKLWGNQLTYC